MGGFWGSSIGLGGGMLSLTFCALGTHADVQSFENQEPSLNLDPLTPPNPRIEAQSSWLMP